MSTRGTAAKSASGASMSKYDVEVEARLKALEAKAHAKCEGGSGAGADGDRLAALEAKVDKLVEILNTMPLVQEHCPKGADGKRRLPV